MADLIAWADVVALAPELGTLSVGTQNLIVEEANGEVIAKNWPNEARAKSAARYLAAHKGTLLKRGGGGAPLQSVSMGGVSKTYAVSMAADASVLRSTSYGQEYLRLLKLYAPRHAVT